MLGESSARVNGCKYSRPLDFNVCLIICSSILRTSRARLSLWRILPLYEARLSVISHRSTNSVRNTEINWYVYEFDTSPFTRLDIESTFLFKAVLAFPSNQFGHQENSNGQEILNALRHVRPGNGFEPKCVLFDKVYYNSIFLSLISRTMKKMCSKLNPLEPNTKL